MKKIKLRAFKIENKKIGDSTSGLQKHLYDKLAASVTVGERRMVINADEENPEEDLISYHTVSNKVQFCTMLRIAIGKDVQHINGTLFNKPSFTIADLHNTELETEAIYKEHYYFGISGDYLVTTLAGNITVTRLQTYINWYLDTLYEITPVISTETAKELSNIESITVVDPVNASAVAAKPPPELDERKKSVFNLPRLAVEHVRDMLVDAKSLTELQLANLISAKLVIEFNKPKKGDPEEVKKAYAALLKPVSDLDHIQIKTRDKRTHKKGSDLLVVKEVSVDLTDKKNINENTLIQAMATFIAEISNA